MTTCAVPSGAYRVDIGSGARGVLAEDTKVSRVAIVFARMHSSRACSMGDIDTIHAR
jgi:hypothetical protein